MTLKINTLSSTEVQYLDAYEVYTEQTCVSKDGKFIILWKIGTKYYAEINTYYDEDDRIVEVEELTDKKVEEYFEE